MHTPVLFTGMYCLTNLIYLGEPMPGVRLKLGTVYGAKSFISKNHKAEEFELWINNKKHIERNKSEIIKKSKEWTNGTA